MNILIMNSQTNSIQEIDFTNKISNIFKTNHHVSLGCYDNELIITITQENSISKLYFYNIEEKNFKKIVSLNDGTEDILSITGIYSILLSPNNKYLALSDFKQGIWIIDLDTDERIEVVNIWKNSYYGDFVEVYMFDWSWDSKKLLLSLYPKNGPDNFFYLDIEQFIKSNPIRTKLIYMDLK